VIIFQFLLGLVFGSFLNVLVWRLNDPEAPKFWQGRSLCPKCRHQLAWKDNIPLLSFVLLKGQCRFCHKPISWQYPVVEGTTALTFVLFVQFVQLDQFGQFVGLGLASCLIVIFFSDLIYGYIPDAAVVIGVIVTLIFNFKFLIFNQFQISNFKFQILGENILIGFVCALPFYIFARLKWMGEGDVGLAFLMSLVLGFPNILVALWFSFVFGGFTAIILLLLKKTQLSATIPLGPFLIIGLIISALWSDRFLKMLGALP
jgi:prepilin signal peptidase PulO-like enzyme (type II secretory pathway)